MPILVGARPGGRNSFAVVALFWTGRLPAMVVGVRAYSGVDAVCKDIMGVFGEWGELTAAGVDAPLTWSGTPNGWRACDLEMKKQTPDWAPKTWTRAPNALPGTIGVQGPALTWAMAAETKRGTLPEHQVFETQPRLSLARLFPDIHTAAIGYRKRETNNSGRKLHVVKLAERFADAGVLRYEVDPPQTPDELDALVSAVSAMAASFPEAGIVHHLLEGGEIRPVGRRQLVILDALP